MKHWESALVGPQIPLEEAIAIMDRSALRIALVIDDQRHLLGTLTDGDVRRALLRHLPLSTQVSEVMCATPKVAHPVWTKSQVLAAMENAQVLHLPVVDAEHHIVGLETLHGLLQRERKENPVFLMAGGLGTRLRPLTENSPKPLLKVGEKPLLELILERFINAGFHRFFVSTHYMAEKIREHFGDGNRWGVSIQYVHEDQPLGTGGALGMLPANEIDMPLFLVNGDLLTTVDYLGLLEFHHIHDGSATMCVCQYEHRVPYGVVQSEDHLILSMVEKPLQSWFINAGIYVISPDLIRRVTPNVRIDMPELLAREIQQGRHVNAFPIHEYWLDVGRMEEFERAQSDIRTLYP